MDSVWVFLCFVAIVVLFFLLNFSTYVEWIGSSLRFNFVMWVPYRPQIATVRFSVCF